MEYDFKELTEKNYGLKNIVWGSKFQPWLFSKEVLTINYDKWLNNQSKFLFITGTSGSGKSTYACVYKNSNCVVIDFDDVLNWFITRKAIKKKWSIDEWKIIYPFVKKIEQHNSENYCKDAKLDAYSELILPFIMYLLKINYPKRIVLEGVWISYVTSDLIKQFPFVLIRSSFIRSWINRYRRDGEGFFTNFINKFHESLGWKNTIDKFMKGFVSK